MNSDVSLSQTRSHDRTRVAVDAQPRRAFSAEQLWITIPAVLRRFSIVLSAATADGIYLCRWPRVATMLPVISLLFGLFSGTLHWSVLTIGDGTISPANLVVAFAQNLPLVLAAVLLGSLGASLGLLLVVGYGIGDFFFAGPQFQVITGTLISRFIDLQIPRLLSYVLFFALAVMPTLGTKRIVENLSAVTRRLRAFGVLLAGVIQVILQGCFVYGWTLAAPMIFRTLWSWSGNAAPITVFYYRDAMQVLLPATAMVSMLVRNLLVLWAKRDRRVVALVLRLGLAVSESDLRPAFSRRLPSILRTVLWAAMTTLLISGLIATPSLAGLLFITFAAVRAARVSLLPKRVEWTSWVAVITKLPVIVRLPGAMFGSYVISRFVLTLPGQAAALNPIAGAFHAELLSLILGLLITVALLPEWPAGSRIDTCANEIEEPPRPPRESRSLVRSLLFLATVTLFCTQSARATCLDPVCCFGGNNSLASGVVIGLLALVAGFALLPLLEPAGALLTEYAWGELSDVLASGVATSADQGEMALDYGSMDLPSILRGLDETEAGQLIQLARGSGGADALSQAMPQLSEIVDSSEDINALMQKIGSRGTADLSGPLQAQRSGALLELRAALSELSDGGRGISQFQDYVLDKAGRLQPGADIITESGDLIQLKNYGGDNWMTNLTGAINRQARSDFVRYGLNGWADGSGTPLSGNMEFQFNARRLLYEGKTTEEIQEFANDLTNSLQRRWGQYGLNYSVVPSY